jgi:hypothetical protein
MLIVAAEKITNAVFVTAVRGRSTVRVSAPTSAGTNVEMTMTILITVIPYVALAIGATMMAKALHLYSYNRPPSTNGTWRKQALLLLGALVLPSLAHAQAVDLRTATESGNAIIMYLSGTFAAVGIVAAGVAMMMGRQSIAKWAFAGAMVSGLAFAIVRTMWSNMGLEAAGVSSFAQ